LLRKIRPSFPQIPVCQLSPETCAPALPYLLPQANSLALERKQLGELQHERREQLRQVRPYALMSLEAACAPI